MRISGDFICRTATVALFCALTGCGSGGGDSSPSSPIASAQFGVPVLTQLDGVAFSIAYGDFDRDGKIDAVAALDTSRLVFLRGKADGSFEATAFAVGLAIVLDVAAVDLNRDGRLDLVAMGCAASPCPESGSSPYVFLGNGAGGFSAPARVDAGAFPSLMVFGDFNGDGVPDMAVGSDHVGILLGNGDGTFKPPTVWRPHPSLDFVNISLTAADFTGDGKQDVLVFLGGSSQLVSVLPGLGNGEFGPPIVTEVGRSPLPTPVMDLNRDGRPDIALAVARSDFSGYFTIRLGKGDGTFGPDLAAGGDPRASSIYRYAFGDLDRDGAPDLVMLGSLGDLGLMYGKGDGTYFPRQDFPLPFAVSFGTIDIVDLNADGRPDLVIHNGRTLAALLNTH